MKKTVIAMSFLAMGSILASCCKKHQDCNSVKTINAVIAKDQTYQFDLGNIEDKDNLAISSQAIHYSQSEIQSNGASNDLLFKYTPAPGYMGHDQVTIVTGSDKKDMHHCNGGHSSHAFGFDHPHQGDRNMNKTTTYVINIRVTGPGATE